MCEAALPPATARSRNRVDAVYDRPLVRAVRTLAEPRVQSDVAAGDVDGAALAATAVQLPSDREHRASESRVWASGKQAEEAAPRRARRIVGVYGG